MTLQEASLVAEHLITFLQPTEGAAITDVLTQLFNGKDLYGQLESLTEGELEEFYQLLSANHGVNRPGEQSGANGNRDDRKAASYDAPHTRIRDGSCYDAPGHGSQNKIRHFFQHG